MATVRTMTETGLESVTAVNFTAVTGRLQEVTVTRTDASDTGTFEVYTSNPLTHRGSLVLFEGDLTRSSVVDVGADAAQMGVRVIPQFNPVTGTVTSVAYNAPGVGPDPVVAGQITDLQDELETLRGLVSGLETSLGTLGGDFITLDGRISDVEVNYVTVQGTVEDLGGQLTDLDGRVAALEAAAAD